MLRWAWLLSIAVLVAVGCSHDSLVLETPSAKVPQKAPDSPKPGTYRITDVAQQGGLLPSYVINYGSAAGARVTDLVLVYRNGDRLAKLRLNTVTNEFSIGTVTVGGPSPAIGDQVFSGDPDRIAIGKVALVDGNGGRVATDLSSRDDIAIGQKLEVYRDGEKVGTLLVTDVERWGSWSKPDSGTRLENIHKGDFVGLEYQKEK